MKDIKSLYLAAKTSRKPSDISSYESAVHEIFESNPGDYVSNLEYIISSDIGLRTLKEFVETYGLPIRCYDNVMTVLEKCLEKCQLRKKDDTEYKEAISYMESFRHKYAGCFMMESFFADKLHDNYVSTYYSSTDAGIQNRKLAAGMINEYGEAAIPDVLITADSIGESAINTTLSYIENHPIYGNPVVYEWVLESVKGFVPETNATLGDIALMSVRGMVEGTQKRNHQLYRESVITGNNDLLMEYSDIDIRAIKDLISINEYKLTWADELNESVSDIQNYVYSLYEELDGITSVNNTSTSLFDETISDSVIPILPNSTGKTKSIDESWLVNTHNKKTGAIPGYLKKNHNLGYGEDDHSSHSQDGSDSSSSDNDSIEPTLDDFKRPSATDVSEPYSGLDDDTKKEPQQLTTAEQKAINNYYYYTYNNSLNKNTSGSFNRDHSTHTSTKKTTDDHSIGKRINSDDITNGETEQLEESTKFISSFLLKSKSKRDKAKPDIRTFTYLDVTKDEYDGIIKKIGDVYKKVDKIISNMNKKYPIYGLCSTYDEDFNDYGVTKDIAGLSVRNIEGKYTFDLFYPMTSGYSIYDFIDNMEKQHPAEFNKLDDGNGARGRWSHELWFDYKFLDYDKNLAQIMTDIENEIKKEVNGVFGFEFWDDWDDGPIYGFYLTCEYLYPKFDPKNIKKCHVGVTSYFAKNLPNKFKKYYFKEDASSAKYQFPWELDIPGSSGFVTEAVGDADNDRPESDHPVKDVLTDIDRGLMKKHQSAKKVVQNVQNTGRAFVKPAVRTTQWITNMVTNWKDADENNVKEKMADPHTRSNLFSAIKKAIVGGSLLKAGLLLNPVFLVLTVTRGIGKNKRDFRLRNEMIGELKTELGIIDEKIKDADRVGDNKAKYQLMRFKNELNKKLLRVGGSKEWKKII